MDDPDLPTTPDAVRRERRERRGRGSDAPPTIAILAGEPDDALLAALGAGGWGVRGMLLGDVFDGLLWAARTEGVLRNYAELPELLLDPAADAACLALGGASGAALLPALLRAGLHVLLPAPADIPVGSLREALDAADEEEVEHAVAFAGRASAPAATVAALLASGHVGQPGQVTVRGWPVGPTPTAELLDVVVAWCGDVVAVCAAADHLPARELPGGGMVRWALLTERGSTVLVAHDGSPEPLVRLSFPTGRLDVTRAGVRWADGDPVELRGPQPWPPGGGGQPVLTSPPEAGQALLAAARGLALDVRGAGPPGPGDALPAVANLRDLFVVARLREALRRSAVEGRWVETA